MAQEDNKEPGKSDLEKATEEEIKEARQIGDKALYKALRLQALKHRQFERDTMQPNDFTREQ